MLVVEEALRNSFGRANIFPWKADMILRTMNRRISFLPLGCLQATDTPKTTHIFPDYDHLPIASHQNDGVSPIVRHRPTIFVSARTGTKGLSS
jgi:hypothetical protein